MSRFEFIFGSDRPAGLISKQSHFKAYLPFELCGTGGYRSGPVFGMARSCWWLLGPNRCICISSGFLRGPEFIHIHRSGPRCSSKTEPFRKPARTGVYVYPPVPHISAPGRFSDTGRIFDAFWRPSLSNGRQSGPKVRWNICDFQHPTLRNSASGPEIGLPGQISAGF